MVRRYGDEYAIAASAPFVDGGCVNKQSNVCSGLFKAYKENEPSAKPIAIPSDASEVSDESMAMDIGNRRVSVLATASDVVANISLSSFELHARRPDIESAAKTVLLDSITSRGGSGGLSATTISLTAHWPWDQLCRNRYCCFQCVLTPSLTRWPSSSHLDSLEE